MRLIFQGGLKTPLGNMFGIETMKDILSLRIWIPLICSHQDIIRRRFIRYLNVNDYKACTCVGIKHPFNAWLIMTAYIKHSRKMTTALTRVITEWVFKKTQSRRQGSFESVLLQSMYTTPCWLNHRSCTWIIATSEPCLADICIYWVTGVSLTLTLSAGSFCAILSMWKHLFQIICHTKAWF